MLGDIDQPRGYILHEGAVGVFQSRFGDLGLVLRA